MHAPTGIDTFAAIIALIIFVVSMLTLFGMGILLAVGAVASNRPLVTSWPMDKEHTFQPFEQRSSKISTRAWVYSFLGAAFVLVFTVAVYFTVPPRIVDVSKDMNMSNLTQKRAKSEAATPAPAETPAPKAETPPAEAPAGEPPAAEPSTK